MQKFLVVAILFGIPIWAQTGAAGGSIRGGIIDPSGSAVAGAAVRADNLETGFTRAALSNQAGEYEVPLLSSLDVKLSLESAQQTVNVVGDTTLLTTITSATDSRQIQLGGRVRF